MAQQRDLKVELTAKSLHLLLGVLLVLLLRAEVLRLGVFGLLIVLYAALLLFNYRYERELLTRALSIGRADARIPGLDFLVYIVAAWIVWWLFPAPIASAAILILAVADPLAHLISGGFGGTRAATTRKSYLYGGIAGVVGGTLAAWLYVPFVPALLASMVAMIVEAGELRVADHHIDDNLTIPLAAAITLTLAMMFV